jgi:hypothetical protein
MINAEIQCDIVLKSFVPKVVPQREWTQIQIVSIVAFLMVFGGHMKVLFTFKVEILYVIKSW